MFIQIRYGNTGNCYKLCFTAVTHVLSVEIVAVDIAMNLMSVQNHHVVKVEHLVTMIQIVVKDLYVLVDNAHQYNTRNTNGITIYNKSGRSLH